MNFFNNILAAINSPAFYSTVPQNGFGKALKYFLLLALCLTIITSVPIIINIVGNTQGEVVKAVNETSNFYPDELEIKIDKGRVSTNVNEPYFIKIPRSLNSNNKESNLLVIDTNTPFSASKFNEYKTAVWLTKDSVFYQGQNTSEIKAYDLSKIDNFTVNKDLINSLADKIKPWIKFVAPVLSIAILIGVYISYDFKLFYLLFLALIILVLSKILKKDLSYWNAYKLGLYGMTLGLIIDTFLGLTSGFIHFKGFPFMFTLISLGVIYINYFKTTNIKNSKNTVAPN